MSSLLNNRMDKVLEDYDPSRCQELYSDDSGCAMSTRSDAVSEGKVEKSFEQIFLCFEKTKLAVKCVFITPIQSA